MTIVTITPARARKLIDAGATLIDIREPDEHAREQIPGAVNVPVSRLCELPAGPVVFHCKSGMRTTANTAGLINAADGAPSHIMEGGIDAWRAAGLPTRVDAAQPLEIMRQVQIAAGSLILIGVVLGFLVAPAFFGVSAFVGAGLTMAGATGWCGMARLLRIMPWNRSAFAA
jgi:rhodanese-related sulfurtransferase